MSPPETPDILVILGCRVGPRGQVRGALARRVERGARTALELGVPRILVTGGRAWRGVREADAMRRALIERGIDPTAIVSERRSLSTWQNARFSAPLLRALDAHQIGVVTCDWHMPRALRCFAAVGVDAAPVPAPSPPVFWAHAALRAAKERVRWWTTWTPSSAT
jgi:uncharacterized SAM-binding protein YcdF (DUF218 family)